MVISSGPQPDALDGLTVPPNAVCRSYIPQVDLLQSGAVSVFVTHGGQNSFTESMANGVPLVVVPGFGVPARPHAHLRADRACLNDHVA